MLESRYNELKEELNNVEDYQHLSFQHETFLSSITTQCFLSHPIISCCIRDILEKVSAFCSFVEAPPAAGQNVAHVEALKEDFDGASVKFIWALRNTLEQNRNSRHMAQLVMRIDYNKFFTKSEICRKFLQKV